MGVWRNWHTRKIQNFVGVKSRVGSSPTTPTMTIKGKKVLEAIETQIYVDQLQELLDYYNTASESASTDAIGERPTTRLPSLLYLCTSICLNIKISSTREST